MTETLAEHRPRIKAEKRREELLLLSEWLVTNAIGGYSSGTISGVITRRYHALLVAALPLAFGRRAMLTDLVEQLVFPDGTRLQLGGEERAGTPLRLNGASFLAEFKLETGLPLWRYEAGGTVVEKRLMMPHGQNSVYVNYRMVAGQGEHRIELRPCMNFRSHEDPVSTPLKETYVTTVRGDRYEFSVDPDQPRLRLKAFNDNAVFVFDRKIIKEIVHRVEESRGYEARGDLWSPGYFGLSLSVDREASLVASTEGWEAVETLVPGDAFSVEKDRRRQLVALAEPGARSGRGAELIFAADQFIITPKNRREDAARAQAAGDEARTIIAGYHWFTDWGRDTMISLEGLTLVTGRQREAAWILRTFAQYIRNGLIPNLFPEGQKQGLYHTADATLWFFHAIGRYARRTGKRGMLRSLVPRLVDIVNFHIKGTEFNIHADPDDGLLVQGEQGYALTWMDAKAGDWVVTPRRGKAVEINALWYNALRLLEQWTGELGRLEDARRLARYAEKVRRSFNERFWYAEGGYLYDVVDGESGNDASCRPNQIFAVSLDHPVLERSSWEPVVMTVKNRLLTPLGLRSLAPGSLDYKPNYHGDRHSRDAAYHQGTVWAWLIGPFIDAWLKLYPDDREGALRFLEGFHRHMKEAGIGTISEIFDAEEPYTPRGCIAQAWSVAEVLRTLAMLTPSKEGPAARR